MHTFGAARDEGSQRFIVLVHTKSGDLYALDAKCHHMGGALWEGDIEELPDGASCLRCPVHKRLIELSTGQVIQAGAERIWINQSNIHALKLQNPNLPPQRTHLVSCDGETVNHSTATMLGASVCQAVIHVNVDTPSVERVKVKLAIACEMQGKQC